MLRKMFAATLLLGVAFGPASFLHAQDGQNASPAQEGANAAPDPFVVPEGTDTQTLELYLRRLANSRPEELTPDTVKDHLQKADKALATVLSREQIEDDVFLMATQLRIQFYGIMEQIGDEASAESRTKFIEDLKKSPREAVKKFVALLELEQRVMEIATLDPAGRTALIDELNQQLVSADKSDRENYVYQLQAIANIAQTLEHEDPTNALHAYTKAIAVIQGLDDENIKPFIPQMEASVRRLELLVQAKPMQVAGKTVDGKDFNIDQYKGKVVLVDFWATWCGPCRAELPHLKEMYEAYHDKGFEVVGISLDEDRESLEEMIKEEELKWITLFDDSEENLGWNNPIARHYGISGIPTVILIDQQGKVVSLNARGQILTDELAKLLGPLESK